MSDTSEHRQHDKQRYRAYKQSKAHHRREFRSAFVIQNTDMQGVLNIFLSALLYFGDFNVFRSRRLFDDFILFDRAVENGNSSRCVFYEKFGIVRNHDDEFVFGNVFQIVLRFLSKI